MAARNTGRDTSRGQDEPKLTTLYAPDGREYKTANDAEITRLKAAGYSDQAPPKEEAEQIREAEDAVVIGPPAPPTL